MNERVVPFEPSHIGLMDVRENEVFSLLSLPDIQTRLMAVARATLASETFLLDGRIIFAAGLIQICPGVLESWIVPSIYVPEYPCWFVKKVKTQLEVCAETFQCHRIQTASLEDDFHTRWMQAIGFTKEGVLRQYNHLKQDYAMYSRIF